MQRETNTGYQEEKNFPELGGTLKLRAEAFQTCSAQEGSHRSHVASRASNVASMNGDVYVYTKNMLDFKDLEKRM